MLSPTIKLGKLNSVDFKISVGWIGMVILFVSILQSPEWYNQYLEVVTVLTLGRVTLNPVLPQSQILMLGFSITVILGIYLSVILHEIGHATAARRRGIKVRSIKLWVAGGVAKIEAIPSEEELPITIAGPAVTALLIPIYALICLVLFTFNLTTIGWIFLLLSLFNILMLLFNLLPLFPLDGGRILRSLLTRRTSYLKATKYAYYTTVGFIISVAILMITFGDYRYLFSSAILGAFSYISYSRFRKTYDAENIATPDDFFIYDQSFALDVENITEKQKDTIITYLNDQGGEIARDKREADYIVKSVESFHLDNQTKSISPLVLVQKLEQNGAILPQKIRDQLK